MGPLLQDPDLIGWSRVEGSDFFYNVIVANCNCNIMKEIPLYGWQVGPTPIMERIGSIIGIESQHIWIERFC